jgi:hypothetical protein
VSVNKDWKVVLMRAVLVIGSWYSEIIDSCFLAAMNTESQIRVFLGTRIEILNYDIQH